MSRIIISVVLINITFTIFITVFLENTMKNSIIEEMSRTKVFSIDTIEQDKITEESVWKTLSKIKNITNSYVAISNKENRITEDVSYNLNEEEIINVLEESNNIKSIIKF